MFDRQLFTAEWGMSIKGVPIDDRRRYCCDNFEIGRQADGSDTLKFDVSDPDFLFLEDNIFVEDAAISFYIRLTGDTVTESFNGYISAIDVSFPDNGCPLLTINCIDNSHLMNKEGKSRSWDNCTSASVVAKIAKEHGFKCVVEKGYNFTVQDTITQSDQTDIEFCESLADDERDPFMCKLIGDTLYYIKKKVSGNPKVTLVYKDYPHDVKSASLQINKETKKTQVTKSDINTDTKKTESSVASNDKTSMEQNGDPVTKSNSSTNSSKNLKFDPVSQQWKEV